ncbi:hypothetical protein MtrunA17_Chr7g0262851 [Medicago truncatula]|uniref:Uncharacterized protein n=1 Tax=Medicago truncatula TaxID=3880 RepID=A0A396H743_MEDTR|nr:hypothetical protein MtrunA17_Chr7g0262851 [Medicago truncatula]
MQSVDLRVNFFEVCLTCGVLPYKQFFYFTLNLGYFSHQATGAESEAAVMKKNLNLKHLLIFVGKSFVSNFL